MTVQVGMGAAFRGLLFDISTAELFQIRTRDGNGSFPISILNLDLETLASYEVDLSSSGGVLIENVDGEILFTPLP